MLWQQRRLAAPGLHQQEHGQERVTARDLLAGSLQTPPALLGPALSYHRVGFSQTGVSPVGPPQWLRLKLMCKERLQERGLLSWGRESCGGPTGTIPKPTGGPWEDGKGLLTEVGSGERQARGENRNREVLTWM